MKIRNPKAAGFTLVEIAISMAIIAFALGIIISILPSSLRVQRDVREESLVLEDGNYLLEALRHGMRGVDGLLPSVDQVTSNGVPVPVLTGVELGPVDDAGRIRAGRTW